MKNNCTWVGCAFLSFLVDAIIMHFYHELNILKNGGNQTDPKRSYRHTPAWPKQLGLRPHFRSKRPWEWCKPPHADAAPLSSACSKPVPSPLQLHSLSAGSIKLKPRCFQPHFKSTLLGFRHLETTWIIFLHETSGLKNTGKSGNNFILQEL